MEKMDSWIESNLDTLTEVFTPQYEQTLTPTELRVFRKSPFSNKRIKVN